MVKGILQQIKNLILGAIIIAVLYGILVISLHLYEYSTWDWDHPSANIAK